MRPKKENGQWFFDAPWEDNRDCCRCGIDFEEGDDYDFDEDEDGELQFFHNECPESGKEVI